MEKKSYLNFYFQCKLTGYIPYQEAFGCSGGLCGLFGDDEFFNLLEPHSDELETTAHWGYWGCDGMDIDDCKVNRDIIFTPLRQNIVLLMAALNDEL